MATASHRPSFLEKAEEDLTCPLCFEVFIPPWIPKELDCVHVCCLLCLNTMVDGGRQSIDCPECRQVTRVPADGVKALKTNLKVLSLAENYQKFGTQKGGSLSQVCEKHDGEVKHLVCIQCKVYICSFCLEEEHQSHSVKAVKTFQKQQKKQEEEITAELHKEINNLEEYASQLTNLEEKVQEELRIEMAKLHKHVQSIVDRLHEKEEEKINELQEITKKENLEAVTSEKNRVESLITNMKAAQVSHTKSSDSLSDEVIFQQEMHLAQMKSLLHQDIRAHIKPHINVQYHPIMAPDDIKIGEFRKAEKMQLLSEFGEFRDARSIAVTSTGLILVLSRISREVVFGIHVFEFSRELNTFNLKETLRLTEDDNSNPVDLSVALMDKYLVACGTCVDVISSAGQYEQSFYTQKAFQKPILQRSMKKSLGIQRRSQSFRGTKPKKSSSAHCLTVTKDGKVIVGNQAESTITMFNSDHTILKDAIVIPTQPWHLATNDVQIAISDNENNKLCAMTIETEEITFTASIDSPQGLCYDTSDTILVTQYTNIGSIQQFCSKSGQWLAQVVSGLSWPLDISVVSDDKVAVLDMAKVNLFSIKNV